MFEEAEQQGFDETNYWESAYAEKEYPNDTDAFRMYMKEVYRELKQSSAVLDLRRAVDVGQDISRGMVEAVFRAYERIVTSAAENYVGHYLQSNSQNSSKLDGTTWIGIIEDY